MGGILEFVSGRKPTNILGQIEKDLLADKPLETLLRKLILLGGNAGSTELRDWASAELRGYETDEGLPAYRRVNAPIQIDGLVPGGVIHHETISVTELPDFAREHMEEVARLRMGVREIQSMVDQHKSDHIVKLQPAGAADLVRYMNATQSMSGRITALYWSVSTVALEGVLDQVRTRLAELIAELRSRTPADQMLPTPVQAANAVNLVINGRGNRVNIAQAAEGGTVVPSNAPPAPRFWTAARTIAAMIVGLATVIGTVVAILQAQP